MRGGSVPTNKARMEVLMNEDLELLATGQSEDGQQTVKYPAPDFPGAVYIVTNENGWRPATLDEIWDIHAKKQVAHYTAAYK